MKKLSATSGTFSRSYPLLNPVKPSQQACCYITTLHLNKISHRIGHITSEGKYHLKYEEIT